MGYNLYPKKILLLSLIFLLILFNGISNDAKAQMVLVPDSNFRNALINLGVGTCFSGDSIDINCPHVLSSVTLLLKNKNIHDLTGIEVFRNLIGLNCSENYITSLPQISDSIQYLDCSYNDSLANIFNLPSKLITFYCSINSLTTLPNLPSKLNVLRCDMNRLTSIPALPASLKEMNCSSNPIHVLPLLPLTLENLICSGNQLASLPLLPKNLKYFICSNNSLSTLPALPDSIISFNCDDNNISTLPVLPPRLESLNCRENNLSSLPTSLSNISLKRLYCPQNNLQTLPILPNGLEELDCSNNKIYSLPGLPSSLTYLRCNTDSLISLPVLPPFLKQLNVGYNKLTSLPSLPKTIYYLDCSHNNLTSLPDLPDSLSYFAVYNNLNLNCLPFLTNVNSLVSFNTGITCIPNYGTGLIQINKPLCDLFNSNSCKIYWNISGKTFFDADTNCTFSNGDINQSNFKINLYQNGNLIQQAYTGGEGFYSFDTDSLDIYETKIDTTALPFDIYCPASGFYTDTLTITDSLKYNRDFALKCKSGFDLAATSIHANEFRPARIVDVHISAGDYSNMFGAHCASGISGDVKIVLSGDASYSAALNGALIPNVSGDTLTYAVADFSTLDYTKAFNFSLHVDTSAIMSSQVCISVTVSPRSDNNPSNNFISQCFTVVGSFDPNDKQAYPENTLAINGDRWLTYTINFQNTGTAEAENIYLTDTLDSNLDLSTFQLLAYSHQPYVQILDGGIAKFNFPNINLPDSLSDEPNSHGYVQYKIKAKANLPLGTLISNTANIYFDFNSPVITNTTVNEIISTVGISENHKTLDFNLYPNPANDFITIETDKSNYTLSITDNVGRLISSAKEKETKTKLPVSQISNGVYFITLTSAEGNKSTKKFIKY